MRCRAARYTILPLLFVLLALTACTTAPVATTPATDTNAGAEQPFDTRGGDVYTYQQDSGLNGQSVGAGATGALGSGALPGGGPNVDAAGRIVYFQFDSAEVRPEARPIIEAHARYLLNNPGAIAILEGHADERGTREYNIALGERRSDAVRRLMQIQGVQPQQLRIVSYGEEQPALTGHDEASYAQNRRVVINY